MNSHAETLTRPKRIALVIHALYGGGAERLMSQLADRWSAAGHDVHLITLADVSTDRYTTAATVKRHGLDMMENSRGLFSALKANWRRVRSLHKLIDELAPDFILSFCDRTNITTVTAALALKRPLWIAEHSDPSRQLLGLVWETWRQWAYRRLARATQTGCVVLTSHIAQTMHNRFPGLNIKVIPPAITMYDCITTITQKTDQDLSAPSDTSSRPLSVLAMGRHSPEKNFDGLLRAWSQVEKSFPGWRLVLAGDGPEHESLKKLAQQLQIGGSVHFAGWVSDPWSLYRQSNLLAMTSHYEGVPVAMLEAMATGLACISTPCSSSVESLRGPARWNWPHRPSRAI